MSKQVQDAYIVAATRTPIGRSGRGYFKTTRSDDLLVTALRAALAAGGHPMPDPFPWDFPRPETQAARLQAAGFRVASVALIPRPTPLPTGIAGWLATFAAPFLAAVPESGRAAVLAQAEALLPALCDDSGQWWADYVRLRFVAEKPA